MEAVLRWGLGKEERKRKYWEIVMRDWCIGGESSREGDGKVRMWPWE